MTGSATTYTGTTTAACSLEVSKKWKSVSLQAKIVKVSGTVAGYAVVKGSIDGTNYVDISTDSLLLSNVTTNTKIWIFDNAPYQYFKISATGAGTMSATLTGYLLPNDPLTIQSIPSTANLKSTYSKTSDTITNSATNYLSIQVVKGYNTVTIQPIVTKISGTVAGTVTLQGSNDGTNYVTVSTSYLLGASATLTALNQTTTTKLFVITGSPYEYYRLSYTGTGTMAATLKGYLTAK